MSQDIFHSWLFNISLCITFELTSNDSLVPLSHNYLAHRKQSSKPDIEPFLRSKVIHCTFAVVMHVSSYSNDGGWVGGWLAGWLAASSDSLTCVLQRSSCQWQETTSRETPASSCQWKVSTCRHVALVLRHYLSLSPFLLPLSPLSLSFPGWPSPDQSTSLMCNTLGRTKVSMWRPCL